MLKIENLKKGDKIYCIKNYMNTKRNSVNNQDLNKCSTPLERANYIRNTISQQIAYIEFFKNKTYIVTSKIGTEIYVKGEETEVMIHIDKIWGQNLLDNHFISFIEGRKLKLQSLSNNKFLSLLKKITK